MSYKLHYLQNFLFIFIIAAEIAAIIFLCLYIPTILPAAVAIAAAWLVTLVTICIAVHKSSSKDVSVAAVLLISSIPIIGAVIYLLSSRKSRRHPTFSVVAPPQTGVCAAAQRICSTCAAGYDRAVYLKSGEQFFTLLKSELERAEKYIYMEYFIISRGEIFAYVLTLLAAAHKRGVEIKIIMDGIGSAFRIGKREIKSLKAAGAKVKVFNRLIPLPLSRLNIRDHRKICVIDGKVTFLGGVNIGDEYANIKNPFGYWKDTGIALYGGVSEIYRGMFLSVWAGGYVMSAPKVVGNLCLPYHDSFWSDKFAENAYVAAISSAKERVHIFTPYFCVSESLSFALEFAAKRGVDVKIILPHIPDRKLTFEISKANALPLARAGVKFYEYIPGFMHAKSVICDDTLYMGSYNMDFRSLRLNLECGVMLSGWCVVEAERDFLECMRLSCPLDTTPPPFYRRILQKFLSLFSPLA
jgi:cardiolipin synthase